MNYPLPIHKVMIEISATYSRTFEFPADFQTCYTYYAKFRKVLKFLPHISLVTPLDDNQYRLVYRSTELGIYRISVFCDLQIQADKEHNILEFRPLREMLPAVPTKVGWNSLIGNGEFSSRSVFHKNGASTNIDYTLKLQARLPVPFALKLLPKSTLNQSANLITSSRIQEIAEGFISNSIREYDRDND